MKICFFLRFALVSLKKLIKPTKMFILFNKIACNIAIQFYNYLEFYSNSITIYTAAPREKHFLVLTSSSLCQASWLQIKTLGLIQGGKDTAFIPCLTHITQTYMKTRISILSVQSVLSPVAKSKNWHSKLQL